MKLFFFYLYCSHYPIFTQVYRTDVFLHNIKLSNYNNSSTKPLLKNHGNLTLSSCELNGNLPSVVYNDGGEIKVKNVVVVK